ncbi:helix-turn-helix transcriptional regulator [Thiofilum flexile]|uniref:helix-turn-helix transcriptional regulator n=1 Tax=Thiofilum flexile TaxID=125627 RepID=UPI00037F7C82|nr:helix-turn-helix transcriptional regulator [Thiofilum flexile]
MSHDSYMCVKQVADYLHLNEKKVYELVKDNQIPATKVTGKWLFPRSLIDRWIMESAYSGLLSDRLAIVGSDDPLFYRVVMQYTHSIAPHGLVSYFPTGTGAGLKLLQMRRADACCLHWGPSEESHLRHPALLQQYRQANQWVLVHLFRREQGLMLHPDLYAQFGQDPEQLFRTALRWVGRQAGAGSQRFLQDILSQHGLNVDTLSVSQTAYSEREAAALIAMRHADIAPGARAAAMECGLAFMPFGWEAFDIALPRNIWFRHLFQNLLKCLRNDNSQKAALGYRGYDLERSGELLWGGD